MPLRRRYPLFILSLVLLASFSAVSFADTLWLKNGDHLNGEIISLDAKNCEFKTNYAGELHIDVTALASFETSSQKLWQINTIQHLARIEKSNETNFVMMNQKRIALTELSLVKDVPESNWSYFGHLETAFEDVNKNNHNKKWHIDGDLTAKSKSWRNIFRAEIKNESESSRKITDSLEVNYALDYFIRDHWLMRSESIFREENADAHDRTTSIGLGPGYRFWGVGRDQLDVIATYNRFWIASPYFNFTLNAWAYAIDYKKFFLGGKLETYADLKIAYPDWTGIDYIKESTIGLRYLFTEHLFFSLKYDYNETQSFLGRSKETSYLLGAGLNF